MRKGIYFFELILVLFIVAYRFVLLKYFGGFTDIIASVFWIGSVIVLYKLIGLRKDNSIIRINARQIVIISILLFILISYLSGMYFGFLKNSYSLNFLNIIKNIYPLVIMITSQELIRYMVAKKCTNDYKPLVILTILYTLITFVVTFNSTHLATGLKLFIYITNTILPCISRNILCSYLCVHTSYVPGLILRLFFNIYIYLVPIVPDYGYYISSIVGVLLPYILYIFISKLVQIAEQTKLPAIKKVTWYLNVPVIAVMLVLVILVSGIFRYQIMAIGSGSMEPYMYKGDAVVFEKINKEQQVLINEKTIIVFKHGNKYVNHRVVSLENKNGKRYYQTKGDNNPNNDDYLVSEDEVVGIVRLRIKGIGLPTIWFQELIG